MKINQMFRVGDCGECPDCQRGHTGWECKKFGHNVSGIEVVEARDKLFESCRLPELKEIKVWFELRPENADKMDVCVYCNEFGTWEIDIKIFSQAGEWVQLAAFIRKIDAEAFLGCIIPG